MARLFTAIAIPRDVEKILSQYVLADEKVTLQKTPHITIQFIGNIDEERAKAIEDDLQYVRVEPFELSVEGCAVFKGRGSQRILVAKVEHNARLSKLHDLIGDIISSHGVDLDSRDYKPHITLTRLRNPGFALLSELKKSASEISLTLPVTGFVLYSAEPGPKPEYSKRREYRF